MDKEYARRLLAGEIPMENPRIKKPGDPAYYYFDPRGVTEHTKFKDRKLIGVPTADTPNPALAKNIKSAKSTDPDCYMNFDGENLELYKNGERYDTLSAMSGQKGYQGKEYQSIRDKGPLPEGRYTANQDRRQEIDLINAAAGIVGRKQWPGSVRSWGLRRVWLDPDPSNEMYGRDNFSIHGGWSKGSAGCIDIPWQTKRLSNYLDQCQQIVPLDVKYKKDRW